MDKQTDVILSWPRCPQLLLLTRLTEVRNRNTGKKEEQEEHIVYLACLSPYQQPPPVTLLILLQFLVLPAPSSSSSLPFQSSSFHSLKSYFHFLTPFVISSILLSPIASASPPGLSGYA